MVTAGSPGAGMSLETLRHRGGGATVLAVLRGRDGGVEIATDHLVLGGGDHVLVLGTEEQLEVLEASLEH